MVCEYGLFMSLNSLSPINQKIVKNAIQNKEMAIQKPIEPVKKIDKKKLTAGIMAGIGITALVVGGILYHNSKAIKKLCEHIDFKKAQTLDEAIKFGKDNLGIEKYSGFEQKDVDIVNWINEGLVNVNNKFKGKAKMPKVIKYTSNMRSDWAASMRPSGELEISKNNVENIKNAAKEFIKSLKDSEEKKQEMINTLTYSKARNILALLLKKSPDTMKSILKGQESKRFLFGTFDDIYHEMGHFQHLNNVGVNLFNQLSNYDLSKTKLNKKGKELWDLFNKSKDTVLNVSDYAKTTPAEFVAETFNGLCYGIKYDDKVMDLYQKLGGAVI